MSKRATIRQVADARAGLAHDGFARFAGAPPPGQRRDLRARFGGDSGDGLCAGAPGHAEPAAFRPTPSAWCPIIAIPSRNLIDSVTFEGLCDGASLQRARPVHHAQSRKPSGWPTGRSCAFSTGAATALFSFQSGRSRVANRVGNSGASIEIPAVVCYRRDVPKGVAWVDPDNERIVDLALRLSAAARPPPHRVFKWPEDGGDSSFRWSAGEPIGPAHQLR